MKTKEEILKEHYNHPLSKLEKEWIYNAMEAYAQSNSHIHVVMQGLPTENEISAMACLTVNLEDSEIAKLIHKAAFETGARWAISQLSGSPTVASEGMAEANTCAGLQNCVQMDNGQGYCDSCGEKISG